MPGGNSNATSSFWQHVDALRGVLMRALAFTAVIAVAAFAVMPAIFDSVIMAPCSPDFITYRLFDRAAAAAGYDGGGDFAVDLVSMQLASQLMMQFSSACWTALLLGFPVLLRILWGFVEPALYEHERRAIVKSFIAGTVMFYLGAAVAYFIVFPLAVRFLADYTLSAAIRPVVSLESYMDTFFTIMILMGAVFELPLVAWLLGKIGILTRDFFSRYRRHAIVILLIIAAIITPTGDPFTLLVVFIPIYVLWECSARLVPAPKPEPETCHEI